MASVAALAIGLSSCSNFLDELPDNRTELNENMLAKYYFPPILLQQSVRWEMSSDNTDAYPNRFSSFNRLQEDLYKWADSAEQIRTLPMHFGNLAIWQSLPATRF